MTAAGECVCVGGGGQNGNDLASCYDFLWQTPEFTLGFWAFFPVVLEVMVL